MQLRQLTPLLLFSTLVATAACVESPDDDDLATTTAELNGPVNRRPTGNPVTIPVCFAGPDTVQNTLADGSVIAESTLRGWIREVVESQWSRFARVNFTGWGTCNTSSQGVKLVLTQPTRPGAPGWDSGLGHPTTGEIFVAHDGVNNIVCRANATVYQRCVKSMALHTFGHILGFNHQENRADYFQNDAHTDCRRLGISTSDQLLGAIDLTSTMSTCGQPNDQPATFKTALSPGDIASAQVAYGRRVPGQIVSPRGGDMLAANLASGPLAFLWDGDEAAGQLWTYNWATQTISQTVGGTTACVDTFPSAIVGRLLFAGSCFGDNFQKFGWNDVNLRGFGGLCLETPGSFASGTQLRNNTCTDDGRQRWAIDTQRRIKLIGTSQCVTADLNTIGAALTLQPCGQLAIGTTQTFTFTSDGTMRFGTDRCVDTLGPTTTDFLRGIGLPAAGRVFTYYCGFDHELTQRWNLSGRLQHNSGLCVDHANAVSNGSTVPLATCNNSETQRWDYYWR